MGVIQHKIVDIKGANSYCATGEGMLHPPNTLFKNVGLNYVEPPVFFIAVC